MDEVKEIEELKDEKQQDNEKAAREVLNSLDKVAADFLDKLDKLHPEARKIVFQKIITDMQQAQITEAQKERANLTNRIAEDTVKTFVLDFYGVNDYPLLVETKKLFLLEEIASNLESIKQILREKKL